MKAAVFLERDGILTVAEVLRGQPVTPLRLENFKVNESVKPLLQSMKDAGLVLLVATNQPAVSRGELPRNELDLMHRVLLHKLPVDDILLCASDDTSHPCYKPQPGLFLEAAFKWSLDLDRSFVISDKWQDAKAAHVAGCTSVMVRSPWVGKDHHDFIVENFAAAVKKVLQLHAAPASFCAMA